MRRTLLPSVEIEEEIVASPFVVYERGEVGSVAGSPPFGEASEQATAGR